ncbi:TPA: YadA-like family protein [Escherichia coli]|uniref:YadA-like family protein n=1 Tax=Escherichia coli TaxID=562 RepID=UPI001AD743A9|nr:YadA-like family protein [Escherichia coli]MDD8082325.1 YadA-like family protein [Escherichia coli]QTH95118.1 YadA-like family protein [Escherichia coli]HBN0911241.1 YadA-like family protein [Escherichia coli]HBN1122214.1 YadA-like family protein [Escherichia coli]HDQ1371195.1 YadA-like family protein [Escherichia coli]
MNKIFKVIWNPATGNYTVTSETAKSRGKKSGRSKLLISALVAGGLLSSFGALADNYDGQGVDYGDGSASDGWVAIGKGAKANIFLNNAGASTALGYDAIAEGQYSSAIGSKTHAIGGASMAFGVSAISEGDRSIALGASSYSFGQYSMALGRYSKALGRLSIAMGDSSKADGANAIALGNAAKAAGIMSIGLGDNANASQDYAMALGAESEAAENATAIGNKAHAKGVNSIALGNGSQALADSAIAIGQGNKANGADAIALGNGSQSSGLNAIALGKASVVTGDNSLALGSNTNANGINSVALGAGSIADQDDSVSVGSDSLQRKIVNVKNGTIKADSHDAINGSQLYAISDSVAKRLGGGSSVNVDDGTVKAPTYNLKNGNKNNVGDALTVLDQFTLQWDQNRDKYSAAHGSSTASVITDVADGAVSDSSKDAVNGSQLKATNDDVETNTTNIATNTGNIATNTANIATNTTNITNLTDTVGDLKDDALLWNGTAFNAAHGTETTSTITNVKAGTLSDDSTDAVNGSQLKDTNDNVATNTTNIASNTANIATNTSNIADNTANIATNTSNIADNTANIATNTSNIAGNTANIATNTTNIAANTTSINSLNTSVDALEQDAMLWNGTAFNAAHGTETTSTITNVKAGTLSDDSTDAVNGSQLKATNDNVATNTTNIASNTANIATNTANINTLNTSIDTLEQDAILWNGTAYSAAHGTETASTITNVKAGTLSENSTDAVNGAQLNATNANVATNTTNIATNTASINTLNTSIDALEQDALLWDGTAFSAAHGANKDASKITNVLAGTVSSASTDAINGSQLHGLSSSIATYLGGGATVSDSGVFSGPTYNIDGNDYTNVGAALDAINTSLSDSLGDALLWDSTTGAFSAKHGSTASVITNVADGAVSDSSSDAVNGSQLYDVSNSVVDVLGGGAGVNTDGSISAPTYTIANTDYDNVGDALNALDTTLDDAMLWDATAGENGAFSASHDGSASKITNVAAGTISDTSTDAVNGAQLHGVSSSVAEALGGGAAVNSDGSISVPTYTIADTDYTNVGDAMNAIDSTLDNALLWDAAAGENGAFNASHDGKASVITNVANGQINETSTDAVNGSQLNATNMLIQNIAGDTSESYITENGEGINYVRTNDSGLVFEDASATGVGATAVGYNSVASGDSSVAIGQNSSSTIESGIALGSSSVSNRVILQGSRDTSVTEDGVVIGYNTSDGELLGALSIGDDGKYRQIINVADGSEAHDAVTVRQLQNAIGAVATTPSKYFHANSTEEDSLAVGEDSLAMGAKTIVNGDAGIGIGLNTLVLTDAINGIAIGSNASANHANSIAMGSGSQTTRGAQTDYTAYNMDAPQNSVGEFSVGSEDGQRQITNVAAGSADTDAVNVGQLKVTDERVAQNTQSITNLNNQVTNLDTRVTNIENGIGDIVTTGSTKYFKTNTDGVDANAQGKDSVAIGSGSIAAADNSVALGTGSVADEENTISVGSSTNQLRITNVAAGKNATDAVNVAQLKSSEAGGVRYDTKADGSIDYSNITLGGGNGGTTRISNVSAGVNNNDAVNYAQLKQSVQETKQYTDQRMVEMDNKLSKTESKLSGGIASAMAMTGLPQAYTPGASMASIGGGTYNGESAVALGVSMVSANGRWVYKLQGSTNSQGEYSAALGAGIQW